MARNSIVPDLVEETESMRRQGRLYEALEVVERFLRKSPDHPRALLLRSRVLYELDRTPRAAEALNDLARVIGREPLQSLAAALERLGGGEISPSGPAFVTESMAGLLAQQGYFLEALEVYRRLLEGAPEKSEWLDEVARLKSTVEREGSRGATTERVARELEACDLWLNELQRGE